MPTPFLHGWLDAIQRGQAHGGPQLAPGDPNPSIDELLELQEIYVSLTGDRLTLEWLTQTLKPTAMVAAPTAAAAPGPVGASGGWRSWRQRLQQALDRLPKAPRPLGMREWQLIRLHGRRLTRTFAWNGGILLTLGVLAEGLGHNQPLWHVFSNILAFLSSGALLLAGTAWLMGQEYTPVQQISKVTDALWKRSPLAQRYLLARAKNSPLPLLGRDRRHLNRLCRLDGLMTGTSDVNAALPAPVREEKA